jgi:hypothetical protein
MKNKNIKEKKVEENLDVSSLITFDRKTKFFLLINAFVFITLVALKIQGSSTPIWNSLFGIDNKKSKDIIWGEPRGIRQDEWSTWVPNIINQIKNGMPKANYSLGDGNSAYLHSYIPINDLRDIFRPKVWGYHLFDVERGYAFDWNLRVFGLTVSAFLFFMLFTQNNFWISVFGALWLFLSSGQQWWSNNQGELMSFVFFMITSLIMVIFSSKTIQIIFWGLILSIFSYSFLVIMYPPWQIPLALLSFVLIMSYLIINFNKEKILKLYLIKIAMLFFVLSILIVLGAKLLIEAKDAMDMTMNTAYPGKRIIVGGDLNLYKLFAEYLSIFISDVKLPSKWLNICEASGYIILFPAILYFSMKSTFFQKDKNKDLVVLGLLFLLLIFGYWMFLGLPDFLAKLFFLHIIPPYRLLPIFGITSVIASVLILSRKIEYKKYSILIETIICSIVFFVLIFKILQAANTDTEKFFKTNQIIIAAIIFTVCHVLLVSKYNKIRNIAFCSIILVFLIPNIKANPISVGLGGILKNPFSNQVRPIYENDKQGKWAVFGNVLLANLIKAEGANVFNGIKSPPFVNEMEIFDPKKRDNFIYNRGGYINLFSFIDGKDSTIFKLNENNVVNDTYSMYADPCGNKLRKIGVKYVVFTYQPQPAEIRCMTLISSNILPIYKIND